MNYSGKLLKRYIKLNSDTNQRTFPSWKKEMAKYATSQKRAAGRRTARRGGMRGGRRRRRRRRMHKRRTNRRMVFAGGRRKRRIPRARAIPATALRGLGRTGQAQKRWRKVPMEMLMGKGRAPPPKKFRSLMSRLDNYRESLK